jgi:hypothetical protein
MAGAAAYLLSLVTKADHGLGSHPASADAMVRIQQSPARPVP